MYRVKRINKNHLITSRFHNKSQEDIRLADIRFLHQLNYRFQQQIHYNPKYHNESAHVWVIIKCFA